MRLIVNQVYAGSSPVLHPAFVAQSVEHDIRNIAVAGSIPVKGFRPHSSVEERILGKDEVVSSILTVGFPSYPRT
jgi:hypothetical protein